MNITKQQLQSTIQTLNFVPPTDAYLLMLLNQAAIWMFVKKYPEDFKSKMIREALLELDLKGQITFLAQ